jgi:hypothetical protein
MQAYQNNDYSIFDLNLTTASPTLRGIFDNDGITLSYDQPSLELTDKYLIWYSPT